MVSDTHRFGRRLAPKIALLTLVAAMAAACGSAATSLTTSQTGTGAAASAGPLDFAALIAAASPTSAPATAAAAAGGSALSLQDQMVAVIKAVNPAVVEIETAAGLGSGVIYDQSGDIVTNAHVVGSSTTFTVTLSNGRAYPATLVGSYAPDDIAVIKISAPGITAATFGDSSKLAIGDFVLAMGNPLGLQSSVTEGIVSALGRQVSEPNGNVLPDVVQTSAAINPGNSGGALVDLNGEVIGIPTLEAADPQIGGSAPGIGFAISSNRAKLIADQLIAGGKVTNSDRAYLGVQLRDGTAGPVIVAVSAGGPAAKAGLVVGDIVLSIGDTLTPDSQTLVEAIAAHHPGDTVQLHVQHQNGTTSTVGVTLEALPG
jgi:S1-C subfamily serine protease